MDNSEAKWDLDTLLFQCSRGLSNETPDRRRVNNVCAIQQAHGQFLNQAHNGCVLLDVSHMPPAILSVFSHSWSSEKKRVRLRVRPGLLSSPITTIKKETSGHTIHWQSLFSPLFILTLQILMRWKCCSTTLCPRSLEKPQVLDRVDGMVDSMGADTQTLCWDSTQKIGRAHNFFSADWRKSMRAHNEKHRKKLSWPKQLIRRFFFIKIRFRFW